ncbi:hypothetical protein ACR1PO_03320 [Chryseobacterium sp. RRHN12]|uniref:hypothetical protein n=1 Tax=Chryseobacterium sp. RRHN12 TaxID=3437884 RepID=UPI003D9AE9BC
MVTFLSVIFINIYSTASTSYAGIISRSPGTTPEIETLNFMNGSSVINITAATVRIYLLVKNSPPIIGHTRPGL